MYIKELLIILLPPTILLAIFHEHLFYSLNFEFISSHCRERACDVLPRDLELIPDMSLVSEEVAIDTMVFLVPPGGSFEESEHQYAKIVYSEDKFLTVSDLLTDDVVAIMSKDTPTDLAYENLTKLYTTTSDMFRHFSTLKEKQSVYNRLLIKDATLTQEQFFRIKTPAVRGYMFVNEIATEVEIDVAGRGYSITFFGFTPKERDAVISSIFAKTNP